MSRLASVLFRGESVDVEYADHGYEPDTNAHAIDWRFADAAMRDIEPTDAENESIEQQLQERGYEDDEL